MKAYLQRLNPDTGELRFYSLQIQRDLLGRWHVIREWGNAAARGGQIQRTPFDNLEDAIDTMQMIIHKQQKNGYRVMMQEGLKPEMARYLEKESRAG